MEHHNNELPPDTDESFREELEQQHFQNTDVSSEFLNELFISKVVTGILACREPLAIKDLKANCNVATVLSKPVYKVLHMEDSPRPVTSGDADSAFEDADWTLKVVRKRAGLAIRG